MPSLPDYIEFAIRSLSTEFLMFPDNADCSIFQPPDVPSRLIVGRDVCYIEVEGCEIFFSLEMYGVQVVFQSGNMAVSRAQDIVTAITKHLESVVGERLEVVLVYP